MYTNVSMNYRLGSEKLVTPHPMTFENNLSAPGLIEAGFALVPIPHGQKNPIHRDWNLKSNCITTLDEAKNLEGMNIGLAHAYCTPVPTCAIDIDNYKTAKPWLDARGWDLYRHVNEPSAVVLTSGKRYSLKLLYALPIAANPMTSISIDGEDGNVALEFRCASRDGRTVQDVLPPSAHPSGSKYEWIGKGTPLDLPVIPGPLLDLWKELVTKRDKSKIRPRQRVFGFENPPETPRQIATLKEALGHINADCPYDIWRNVVWAILSTGWKCGEELALDWSKSAPHRFDEDPNKFSMLVSSYAPRPVSPITVGTIFFLARSGGWNG